MKRTPSITITITFEERNRVGTVVSLLLAVSKNKIRRRCKAARLDKRKPKDKKKLTYDQIDKGSWFNEPLFLQIELNYFLNIFSWIFNSMEKKVSHWLTSDTRALHCE